VTANSTGVKRADPASLSNSRAVSFSLIAFHFLALWSWRLSGKENVIEGIFKKLKEVNTEVISKAS